MIAGPNGAGKTTLTKHLLQTGIDLGEYINPDDIAAELTGSLAERTIAAQALADERRNECIKARRSFSFETVMSHPSKVDILVRAKEEGYTVLLYFVGTDDPQTNVERVALRVAQGGHPVPVEKIKDRWLRTMSMLQQAIRSSDRSFIFDNSVVGTIGSVPRLVYYRSTTRPGRVPHSELFGSPPTWVQRFVIDPIGTSFIDGPAALRPKTGVGSIATLPLLEKTSEAYSISDTRENQLDLQSRRVPHDIESEQLVLSAIFQRNEAFWEIADYLEPKHFFEPLHQTIFETLSKFIRAGKSTAADALITILPMDLDLGGLTLGQYLAHLENEEVGARSIAENGRLVRELSLRRDLIGLGEDIIESAYGNGDKATAHAQIERISSQLHQLSKAGSTPPEPSLRLQLSVTPGFHQFSRALVGMLDSAARAFVSTGSGIKTGLFDLDRKVAGLQPSELIVLASRPGLGKTALATTIAYNVARSSKKGTHGEEPISSGGIVGFFSLEMSSEQIAARVISQQSRIPAGTIRRGDISETEFEVIRSYAIEFQKLPFFIDDTTTLSIEQLASRASRLKSERGLDLLIIDNLELLRNVARSNFGATRDASLQITRELKKIAKDLAIPVLVLAQLPSKPEKRFDPRPRLEEFGDKGAVEQDADVILLLHRDDFYLAKDEPAAGTYEYNEWLRRMEFAYGRAEAIVAKHRNGETGSIFLSYDPTVASFGDLASDIE